MKGRRWIVAALFAAAPAADAAGRDPVVDFLAPLYRHIDKIDPATIPFAPPLADLVKRDRAQAANGGAGVLDWNPLCGCQDDGGFRLRSMQGSETKRLIKVVVTFQVALQPKSVTVDIVRIGDGFAIADIHGGSVPSLKAHLAREVASQHAAQPARATLAH